MLISFKERAEKNGRMKHTTLALYIIYRNGGWIKHSIILKKSGLTVPQIAKALYKLREEYRLIKSSIDSSGEKIYSIRESNYDYIKDYLIRNNMIDKEEMPKYVVQH